MEESSCILTLIIPTSLIPHLAESEIVNEVSVRAEQALAATRHNGSFIRSNLEPLKRSVSCFRYEHSEYMQDVLNMAGIRIGYCCILSNWSRLAEVAWTFRACS
jgi:hypothetical protein